MTEVKRKSEKLSREEIAKKHGRTIEQQKYRDDLANTLIVYKKRGGAEYHLNSEKMTKNYIESAGYKRGDKLANELIDAGKGRIVAQYIDNFKGLSDDTLVKLIKTGYGGSVVRYLQDLSGQVSNELAIKLIELGYRRIVERKIFERYKFSKEVAIKLIESGIEGADTVDTFILQFEGLDRELAIKLIKSGRCGNLARYLDKFEGLNHNEIAIKLIEAGFGHTVVIYLGKFKGLNKRVALELIKAGEGKSVMHIQEYFEGLTAKELLQKLIELDNFDFGYDEYVERNLDKIKGLDLNKELAIELIKAGKGSWVIKNLEKFKGLDNEVAKKLKEIGFGTTVAKHSEKFGLKMRK